SRAVDEEVTHVRIGLVGQIVEMKADVADAKTRIGPGAAEQIGAAAAPPRPLRQYVQARLAEQGQEVARVLGGDAFQQPDRRLVLAADPVGDGRVENRLRVGEASQT